MFPEVVMPMRSPACCVTRVFSQLAEQLPAGSSADSLPRRQVNLTADESDTPIAQAFQLNPTMPKDGISRSEYRIKKFGSWERSMQLDANIVAVGKEEGIHFDFDRMERTPNTLDAHRAHLVGR